jgi:hypothetical protein
MLRVINSYSAITLVARSLVVFDIDDTLVNFPQYDMNWWNAKKAMYEKIMNKEDADRATLYEWRAAVQHVDPQPIDKDGFLQFYAQAKAAGCDVIFLTARSKKLKEVTHRHLKNSLMECEEDHVFFSENKGPALVSILQQRQRSYPHVIFIDDLVKNHESVRASLDAFGVPVDTYHFQMK